MIALCFGLPGCGKSTLIHDLVRLQAPIHRFFVVDHEAGWGEDSILWRGEPPKELVVLYAGEKLPEELPPSGVFVFRGFEPTEVARLACLEGDTTYVDDEIDKSARRKGWESSGLRAIVHEGRHLINKLGNPSVLHLLGACRRPQNLHTDLTDIADEFYVFRLKGKNTLQRLHADSILESDDQWDIVRNLEKFECLHWPSGKYFKIQGINSP